MTLFKIEKKRLFVLAAGTLVGLVGGWLYWRFVGCLGGSCPIWSNAWIASGYGALLGWLLAGLLPAGKRAGTEKTEIEPLSREET